ncbi:MAG: hypothetical protein KDB66_10475 [Solirubrobacterales bacterium]|nr:hypothetical protein [Solirubrobacterales bacterium]MCB8914650.1 hypothetical protein [Thermoleophilales bacterium]
MAIAVSTNVWYFGAAGLVSLAAFIGLILVPALGSYGRWHERFAAGFLSLLIFGGLVTIGVVAGLAWVLIQNDISPINPFTGG